jgi:hypothetical protein
MKAVKEVLKQKNLPHDYPPTMADVKMREKHVPDSIDHNIRHFGDHGDNVIGQLKKLHMVNPSKAHSYAAKSLVEVKKQITNLESHLEDNCKECKK